MWKGILYKWLNTIKKLLKQINEININKEIFFKKITQYN